MNAAGADTVWRSLFAELDVAAPIRIAGERRTEGARQLRVVPLDSDGYSATPVGRFTARLSASDGDNSAD
jgi:hypothetical protein